MVHKTYAYWLILQVIMKDRNEESDEGVHRVRPLELGGAPSWHTDLCSLGFFYGVFVTKE